METGSTGSAAVTVKVGGASSGASDIGTHVVDGAAVILSGRRREANQGTEAIRALRRSEVGRGEDAGRGGRAGDVGRDRPRHDGGAGRSIRPGGHHRPIQPHGNRIQNSHKIDYGTYISTRDMPDCLFPSWCCSHRGLPIERISLRSALRSTPRFPAPTTPIPMASPPSRREPNAATRMIRQWTLSR